MPEGERVRRGGARINPSTDRNMRFLAQKAANSDFSDFKQDGEVYIVKAVGADPHRYKIGKARDAEARVAQLKNQSPYPLETVYSFPCEDYGSSERALHEVFLQARVHNEWFELTDSELRFLKKIVRMRGKHQIEFSTPPGI